MFYGVAGAWLVVLGSIIWIATREKRLRQELDRAKRMLEQHEKTKRP